MAEESSGVETLERGNIYFFYRPRVDEEEPQRRADVQQLYVVLDSDAPKDHCRLLIVGRKALPPAGRSGAAREWGFVDLVREDSQAIRNVLSKETYETKTRGARRRLAARPCGEGVYRLIRHGDHVHLVHQLELPRDAGDVQEELGIEDQASYVITIKNPRKGSPPAAGLSEDRKADHPHWLQKVFRDRRFASEKAPEFLNHEGTEFVLVSASDDVEAELGLDLDAARESEDTAEIFREMKLDRERRKTEPLLAGDWA